MKCKATWRRIAHKQCVTCVCRKRKKDFCNNAISAKSLAQSPRHFYFYGDDYDALTNTRVHVFGIIWVTIVNRFFFYLSYASYRIDYCYTRKYTHAQAYIVYYR